MEIFEKLGLGWFEILFHVVNLVILVVALYFLLYKPIKQLIANHRAKLAAVVEENARLNEEANESKHRYEQMLAEVKEEAAQVIADATEKTQKKSEETLAAAREQAKAIVETAKREAEAETRRIEQANRDKVADMAIMMAEKILAREVGKEDNKKIIDECLKEWE